MLRRTVTLLLFRHPSGVRNEVLGISRRSRGTVMSVVLSDAPHHRRRMPLSSTNASDACDVGPGKHQTPIVNKLWRQREGVLRTASESLAQAAAAAAAAEDAANTKVAAPKAPRESHTSVTYEFSSDAVLRESYANPWGFVRMGRLIEDLDALAGNIAALHCAEAISNGRGHYMLVTASVDRIDMRHRANLKDDMTLSGSVVWVGKSSMEIEMNVVSAWTTTPWLSARFVFVARNTETGRAAPIPPLLLETEAEKAKFAECQHRNDLRKKQRAAAPSPPSLLSSTASGSAVGGGSTRPTALREPTRLEQASELASDLLLEARPLTDMPALANRDAILMSSTHLSNVFVCQPQQRNTHGRIFGGFLMRRAFELSFATAYLFIGSQPQFREVDEVTFEKPVDVGNMVRFDSVVLYTSQSKTTMRPLVHVEVVARVTRPEERLSFVSNTFHFVFEKRDGGTVRRVLPGTEEEARRVALYLSDPSRPEII